MELNEAIEIILIANGGGGAVPATEFIEATNVVLDAMRNEITMSEAVKWCKEHMPPSTTNTL